MYISQIICIDDPEYLDFLVDVQEIPTDAEVFKAVKSHLRDIDKVYWHNHCGCAFVTDEGGYTDGGFVTYNPLNVKGDASVWFFNASCELMRLPVELSEAQLQEIRQLREKAIDGFFAEMKRRGVKPEHYGDQCVAFTDEGKVKYVS